MTEALLVSVVLVAVTISFVVSAAAGMGGSLVLVPVLVALLGTKEGVALAALLLASNNIPKVAVYRRTLPFASAGPVIALVILGAFVGSRLLVAAPQGLVLVGVVVSLLATFVLERKALRIRGAPGALAFGAGATSGFSGTSGPLKGVALRSLGLDRHHLVGAASLVSLAGDATKTVVFAEAGLLGGRAVAVALASIPLMVGGTLAGRHLNDRLGERGYAALFWLVMSGYGVRLVMG